MYYKENELVLIYNSKSNRDKKTLAYAVCHVPKVNRQDITSCRISSTLFNLALNKLNLSGKELVNKAHPHYQEMYRGKEMSNEEWFYLIMNHPELLKAPIAMYKGKAVVCNSESDLMRL